MKNTLRRFIKKLKKNGASMEVLDLIRPQACKIQLNNSDNTILKRRIFRKIVDQYRYRGFSEDKEDYNYILDINTVDKYIALVDRVDPKKRIEMQLSKPKITKRDIKSFFEKVPNCVRP